MRTTLLILLFLSLSFVSDAKGIFKREHIELIHVVDRCRVSVVTCCYAYDYMTAEEFKREFGIDLRTAVRKYKTIWSPL